jgi:alpha-galactosidase
MTIKLKDAGRVAFGVVCPSGAGQTFTVAVEVKVCQGCEPERFRFLKEHQIHDTCPPERWPTPVELAALTQAVGMLLEELDIYSRKASETAKLRDSRALLCETRDLVNFGRLEHIQANLQTIRDGLEKVAWHS